jgi:tetratricopeptide (TPR) repeat protein
MALAALLLPCGLHARPAAVGLYEDAKTHAPSSVQEIFAMGRSSCLAGEHERCAQAMMDVLARNPHHRQARSYLQSSTAELERLRLREIELSHQRTLDSMSQEIDVSRKQTVRWTTMLAAARRARRSKDWLKAWDLCHRVLRENPLHWDAAAGLRDVRRAIAERLDQQDFADEREARLYAAAQLYDRIATPEEWVRLHETEDILAALDRWGSIRGADIVGTRRPAQETRLARIPAPALSPAAPVEEDTFVRRRADQLFRLAQKQHHDGKLDDAAATWRELFNTAPDHPGAREGAYKTVQAIERANRGNPKDAEEHYQTGVAYYALGRLEEAGQEMEKALKSDPRHVYARSALLRLQSEMNRQGGRAGGVR